MAMSEIQRKALNSRVAKSLSNSWELQFEEEEAQRRKARKVVVGVTGSHDFIFSSECRERKNREREREIREKLLVVFDFLVSLF